MVRMCRESNKSIKKDEALRSKFSEWEDLLRHADRRSNVLHFEACLVESCTVCTKADRHSRFAAMLRRYKGVPSPVPNPERPDHFYSFIVCLEEKAPVVEPDTHLPSKVFGRCDIRGCKWVYLNKTDSQHHKRLFHSKNAAASLQT